MSGEKQKLKTFFLYLLKIGFAVGVIIWIVCGNFAKLKNAFAGFDYRCLLPAMFFYGVHIIVCARRWQSLANMLEIRLTFTEALSLTFQGYFFSLALPVGAVGGDVVKMGLISKRTPPGSKVEGVFTVLMDRIVGMIALFALALALLPAASGLFHNLQLPPAAAALTGELLTLLIALLCLAGLGASCVIFFHRTLEKIPLCGRLMNWGDRRTGGMVRRLTDATDTYAGHPVKLTLLTLASVVGVHLMTVVPMFFLLRGVGADAGIMTVVIAITMGNIAGLIPLSPGGVGIRDLAVIALLTAGGADVGQANAAQLLYTGILIFFNVIGAMFLIFDRTGKTAPAGEVK